MGETHEVQAHVVEIVSAEEAGDGDPTISSWLRLPVGEDECPLCGSGVWGTVNPRGYLPVRMCNSGTGKPCRMRFRTAVTPEIIAGVIDALMEKPRRFWVRNMEEEIPAGFPELKR